MLDLGTVKLLGGLYAPGSKDFFSVVMTMVMSTTAMSAMLMMVMMLMLFMVVAA